MKKKVLQLIVKQWREWRIIVLFTVCVIIPFKSSIADWNYVPTGSMNPTILEGDLVLINKLAYDLRLPLTFLRLGSWGNPLRGDIVVCFSPEDDIRLVKRVIGLPGDRVSMRNNLLTVNGEPLKYDPLPAESTAGMMEDLKRNSLFAEEDLAGRRHPVMGIPSIPAIRNFGEIEVPQGQYFVMGDNRDLSKDSRSFGFVDRSRIIGQARAVIVSFNKLDKYQPRFSRFFSGLN